MKPSSSEEKMTKGYFKVFMGLLFLSLVISFFLLLYSPSDYHDPKVLSAFHHVPHKSHHQLAQDTLNEGNLQPGMDEGVEEGGGRSDGQTKQPDIDVANIGQMELSDSSLIYHAKSVGLTFRNREFFLSQKPFRVLSGSIHYFRLMPDQWKDRLLKLKACGLNTVETYVPWNLHEPRRGHFNFQGILDISSFIKLAGELGLYVILRPGPFICSEIDFGGMPGWLLEDKSMKVRSNYGPYLKAVKLYFDVLLPKVINLQYRHGGPIIMVQVENEYSVYGENIKHLKVLTYMLRTAGIKEMLVTSDNTFSNEDMFFHKYALPTSNADHFDNGDFKAITAMNPHFPFMIMELWTGWFDYWGGATHSQRTISALSTAINKTLEVGGSFNLYMFHGGTNFGFLAGAINLTTYAPFVTSYDYDALLTEAGDITPKYIAVRDILAAFYKTLGFSQLPTVPMNSPKKDYGHLDMTEHLDWPSLFNLIPIAASSSSPDSMESYASADNSSTMGYILYSHIMPKSYPKAFPLGTQVVGHVKDRLLSILNDHLVYVVHGENAEINPSSEYNWDDHFTRTMNKTFELQQRPHRLDLLVENQGRINYCPRHLNLFDKQRKGLDEKYFHFIHGSLNNWQIRFLSFSADQIDSFSNSLQWSRFENVKDGFGRLKAPALFRAFLVIEGEAVDSFIHLEGWTKGVVIVNKFLLGRYWKIGPQISLYVPASLLHPGKNEIMVFEEENKGKNISFKTKPDLGIPKPVKPH